MHIPVLITDLTYMMLTAGIITILFKKIKQPLILGYILAGFVQNVWIVLPVSIAVLAGVLLLLKSKQKA